MKDKRELGFLGRFRATHVRNIAKLAADLEGEASPFLLPRFDLALGQPAGQGSVLEFRAGRD